ncbi:MAG TPA: hypothetical protein VLA77_00410 [Candidatus Saccharimonadales bacterium]|nr:hypothetical protein [Candidatus Saccharimonadales bacterium]
MIAVDPSQSNVAGVAAVLLGALVLLGLAAVLSKSARWIKWVMVASALASVIGLAGAGAGLSKADMRAENVPNRTHWTSSVVLGQMSEMIGGNEISTVVTYAGHTVVLNAGTKVNTGDTIQYVCGFENPEPYRSVCYENDAVVRVYVDERPIGWLIFASSGYLLVCFVMWVKLRRLNRLAQIAGSTQPA